MRLMNLWIIFRLDLLEIEGLVYLRVFDSMINRLVAQLVPTAKL